MYVVTVVLFATDVSASTIRELSSVLTGAERERANRYRLEADRRRSIVSRSVLRLLLAQRAGGDPAEFEFEEGDHGKLSLGCGGPQFNVSHSGEMVAVAFAPAAVGVDIERQRGMDDIHRVAARFFSPAEAERVRLAAGAEAEFFRIWTMKEAVVKAAGGGVSIPLGAFTVPRTAPQPEPIVVHSDASTLQGWSVAEIEAGRGYHGAVAARGAWRIAMERETATALLERSAISRARRGRAC